MRARRAGILLAASCLLAAASCARRPAGSARVRVALPATALPQGTTAVRLAVVAADMAPVAADLPLDGRLLALEVPAGRDRVFTADAFAGPLRTHSGSTTVAELVAGQDTTISIRLLPLGQPDTTPPAVASTAPASGATGVALGTLVVADFSEPLDSASVSAASFALADAASAPVSGTVTLSASGTTATFAPVAPLAPSATYTATLTTAVRDVAGNALAAAVSWSFTTSAVGDVTPPTLLGTNYGYGQWIYLPGDVPIELIFREPMDPATIDGSTFFVRDCARNPIPAATTYSGVTARLTPAAPLTAYGCYEVTITSGARDLAGNALDVPGGSYTFAWPVAAPPLQGDIASPPNSIAAGGTHTLAIASGAAYAWGTNNGGALGTGQPIGAWQPTPRRIPSLVGPDAPGAVHARSWFSEAMASVPRVWGWGPSIGQAAQDNPQPISLDFPAPALVAALSAGYAHSLALDASGSGPAPGPGWVVWGFGEEASGRLGPALGNNRPRPIPGLHENLYRSVAAGGAHSLALRADGTVLAWGDNTYGQLGDGTTAGRSDPRPVPGLTGVAYLSAGDWFSVVVRYDRTVWAWGHNAEGQLGIGTLAESPVPVQVATLPAVNAVSAGASHALALLQDGTVQAWGHNAGGKLGDGTTANRSLPVAVAGLANVAEVSAGEFHSVVRLADGSIWTWGGNALGQLGDGTAADSAVPLRVSIDTTPPALLSATPADGATGVPSGVAVAATFSEALDPATVDASSFHLADAGGIEVAGAVTVAGALATFAPAAPLAPSTTYTATLTTALRDLAGNPLGADVGWSFTTAAAPADTTPPAVVATSPAAGATGVAVGTLVVADLTEPLDPASVGTSSFNLTDAGGALVAGTVTLSASGTTATFAPVSPLAPSATYTATLSATAPSAIRDLAGNALAADVTWTFTTAAPADVTPPSVVSFTPGQGATEVLLDSPLVVTFSEAVDPASVTPDTFQLTTTPFPSNFVGPPTIAVAGDTVTYQAPRGAWFAFGQTFVATLTTGIRDLAGNPLPASVSWTFATPEVPTIVSVSPPDGAVGVDALSPLTVTLSVPLDTARYLVQMYVAGECAPGGTPAVAGPDVSLTPDLPMRPATRHEGVFQLVYNHRFPGNVEFAPLVRYWSFTTAGVPPPRAAVALTAGANHTCALLAGGVARCWGDNASGQLGDGTLASRSLPADVPGLGPGVLSLSAGVNHTCAVTAAGGVKCWGDNTAGKLGDGTTTASSTPVDVAGLASGAVAVSAGGVHSCALLASGGVMCWGDGTTGALGDGNLASSPVPVEVFGLAGPGRSIDAGETHTCALVMPPGYDYPQAECWGSNAYGELGYLQTPPVPPPWASWSAYPNQVLGGIMGETISAGRSFTCSGSSCWGDDSSGQLGDGAGGPGVASGVPVTIQGGPVAAAVASHGRHAAGVGYVQGSATDTVAYTWGSNAEGQLGDGSFTSSLVPVQVPDLPTGVAAMAAGAAHTCALFSSGGVKCWGRNSSGQLGDGTFTASPTPVDALITGTALPPMVASKGHFTLAVKPDGTVWAWGANDSGQLGPSLAIGTGSSTPVQVTGLPRITSVAAGQAHGLALDAAGGVWAWGRNTNGQTDTGSAAPSATPRRLLSPTASSQHGLPAIHAIGAGPEASLAIARNGSVFFWGRVGDGVGDFWTTWDPLTQTGVQNMCLPGDAGPAASVEAGRTFALSRHESQRLLLWGANSDGELAQGGGPYQWPAEPLTSDPVSGGPVPLWTVAPLRGAAAGWRHALALAVDGRAFSWGANYYGQLGFDTGLAFHDLADTEVPVPAPAVVAAFDHTLALLPDGTVRAWGLNGRNVMLGPGAPAGFTPLVQTIGGLAGITRVAAGERHSVAVRSDGTVWTWGQNDFGQLGDGTSVDSASPVQVSGLDLGPSALPP